MVESLKELNKICQKSKYKEVGNWMVRYILRDAALPVTWLLLHTSITANQVTLFSLTIGIVGISLFSAISPSLFLIGTILLQLWYFLDHVDGQIARYRKTASITGRFFDFLTHHIIHGVIFFSLGIYAYQMTRNSYLLVWGFVLSLFIMIFNLVYDVKSKAFIEKLLLHNRIYVNQKEGKPAKETCPATSNRSRKIFSWIHKACEIHVLMNILTASALIGFFWKKVELRGVLFILYSILIPVLTIGKVSYIILRQRCDEEFNSKFKVE